MADERTPAEDADGPAETGSRSGPGETGSPSGAAAPAEGAAVTPADQPSEPAAPPPEQAKPAVEASGAGKATRKATKTAKAAKTTKSTKVAKSPNADKTAKATKAAKKTTTPGRSETAAAPESSDAPPARVPSADELDGAWHPGPAVPGAWASAAWEAIQQPDQPPTRLAELAVAEVGPRAAAWARWLRATYPSAPPYGIARLACAQATRGGLLLALAEAGGPMVTPVRLPAAAWVRATVVLRVAAAYGHDPTDRRRAVDLIELLGLDPGTHGEPLSLAGLGSVAGAAGQLGLARFAVSRLGLRRTPAAGLFRVLAAASDHQDNLTRLAHRAERRYRPGSASSTVASSASSSSP